MTSEVTIQAELPPLQPVTIDPTDSALVIVDMENEFLKPEGLSYMEGRAEYAIGNLAPLLQRFREAGSKVIYVQSVRAETAPQWTVFGQRPYRLMLGTWGIEIVDELEPLPGEPIVQKHHNDCWNHTTMETVLAELGLVPGRSQIVVTGCATNGCVDCAVVGFSVRDYAVWVPVDCTASMSEEAEMLGYLHFFGPGYDYNVIPTQSDLIAFASPEVPVASPAKTPELVAV